MEAAQVAVQQLGSALVDEDAPRLFEALTPDFRSRYHIDEPSGVKGIFEQQRSGWMRTLGADAKTPRVHSVRNGYGEELEVTLEIGGKPSEKKLYFQRVGGELKFSGALPTPGPTAAAAAIVVNRKFAVENFMSAAHSYSYGGDFVFGSSFCGVAANRSVAAYSVRFDYFDCTEAGVGSCKTTFNSDRGLGGANWCASWGATSIDHQHQGGVTGCWWQWVGDDMWFYPMDMHGGLFGYDARCNI